MDSRQEKQIRENPVKLKTPTLFNSHLSRDTCHLIASELDARDIKSLCLASTSTNVQFYEALKLREDAHVILQEVLNGSLTSVVNKIEAARKAYGKHVWKLLVTPTYGRELHNDRRWEAETVVCAAARAGDLYLLLPIPEDERGKTDVTPLNNQNIDDMYLLNRLYTYIPQQCRHFANAQLQALQASKDFLSPYVELITAYNTYVQRYYLCDSRAKNTAWQTDIGNRQKLLPWFGLRILCDHIRWMPLPNFNHLPAPESIPVIYVNGKKELLRDQLPGLGECWAINHGTDNRAWQRSTVEGWGLCARAASALSAFVKAKRMQLSAFISWQKLEEKKYREEQTQSVALRRR